MAFDVSTAKPMINKFDLSTAKLANQNEPKKYLGNRPGIDSDVLRNIVGGLITAGEIAAPVASSVFATPASAVPVSVGTSALGEYLRAMTQGKTQEKALKAGLTGGAVDLALAGAGKALKPALKFVSKTGLKPGTSEYATKLFEKNIPKYTKPIKKEFEDIAFKTRKSIQNLGSEFGKEVGTIKSDVSGLPFKVNTSPIKKDIKNFLKSERFIVKEGVQKGVKGRKVLDNVVKQIDNLPKKASNTELFDTLTNVDDIIDSIYLKKGKVKLRSSESGAKRIRGIYDEFIGKNLPDNKLKTAKNKYNIYREILNDEGGKILKSLQSERATTKLITDSLKKGERKTLKNLQTLDSLSKNKFIDEALNKSFRGMLELSPAVYPTTPGLIRQALIALPRLSTKTLRASEQPAGMIGLEALKKLGVIPTAQELNR